MQPDLERSILLQDTQIYVAESMDWHPLLSSTFSGIHIVWEGDGFLLL